MTQKLKEKIDQTLETPDPSWSQKREITAKAIDNLLNTITDKQLVEWYDKQPQQEPENWEKLLGIQRNYEGMDQLLFTADGDIRHINGYTQGK